jgi:uncharacterized linocin/CFP29 family protein
MAEEPGGQSATATTAAPQPTTSTTSPPESPGTPASSGTSHTPPGQLPHPNGASGGTEAGPTSMHQLGRHKIPWGKEVWERIDHAVATEVKRTRICARFLPVRPVPPRTTSVPTDSYSVAGGVYSVDEGATLRLNEYYVPFELTPQQVAQEEGDFRDLGHSTAVTLATKAANSLALAEDLICFQGQNAITSAQAFQSGLVQTLAGNKPLDTGLLNFPVGANVPGAGPLTVPPVAAITVVNVDPLAPAVPGVIYGSNTFNGVAQAYSQLQAAGQYGPYAIVLETIPYADTYAPLADLTVTADRIRPLVTAGYFGSGTLPPTPPAAQEAPYFGVLVSLGGNTMDLVVGAQPVTAFQQEDPTGNFRFRVLQRFALRVKDPTAIVILQFN